MVSRWYSRLLVGVLALVGCAQNPLPKIDSFSATPDLLGGGGGIVDLKWSVSGADSLSIDQGVGPVTGTTKEVPVAKDTAFTLTATNASGSSTATRTVRLSALGTADWKKQLGTDKSDGARSVATDKDGNVLIGGYTQGAVFANNAGSFDVIIAKYDPSGNELWKKQLGTSGDDGVTGVATDANGNVFVTGYSQGDLFGSSFGDYDAFLVKYDSTGKEIWKKQIGSSGTEEAYSVTTDQSGNVIMSGYTSGALFANNLGKDDIFVAKYDSSGNSIWKKQFGTAGYDYGESVSTDPSGNVIVAGDTSGVIGDANLGDNDVFVVKLDPNGNEIWKKQFGSSKQDVARSVATDGSGNVFVGGFVAKSSGSDGDALLVKYDSAGNEVWKKQLDGGKQDMGYGVATDSSGNAFIAGHTYGAIASNNLGLADIVVVKYDPSGNELWKKQLGTDQNDLARSIATDNRGNVFIAGETQGSFAATNSAIGTPDLFLLRYR